MSSLSPLQCKFINQFQGGVPLTEQPFSNIAALLGTREATLIQLIQELLDKGIISRFGPFYNADRLGGAFTLAAMRVPESRFQEVADRINGLDAVAHNYQREHELNMWFVIAADTPSGIDRSIETIESSTGLKVFNFPKLQEFFLGLKLQIEENGVVTTVPMKIPEFDTPHTPDELDRRIIKATQAGLPLVHEPFTLIADEVGSSSGEVISRMEKMLASGMIRRIGAAPNHYRLGLKANGMTVWDISDSQLAQTGTRMGQLDFVSHCYERPRHLPEWPYNLFAMIHGSDRNEVQQKLEQMKQLFEHRKVDVLFSSAILKKTGMRFAA